MSAPNLLVSAVSVLAALGSLGVAPAAAQQPFPSQPGVSSEAAAHYSIADLQASLRALGYDPGPADGQMGMRTREAIRAYQQSQGLPVTGEPSRELFAHVSATLSTRMGLGPPATAQQEAMGQPPATQPGGETGQHYPGQTYPGQPYEGVSSPETVVEIQSGLRRLGYNVASVSGTLDEQTRAAIADYQRANGLAVTGEPSAHLAGHLAARLQSHGEAAAELSHRDRVLRVQQALNQRGYDAGPADGMLSPRTRDAIRTYESDAGLPVTGEPSERLAASLGLAAGAAGSQTGYGAGVGTPRSLLNMEVRITDDFADGDYTQNPHWQVHSGRFAVETGMLRTRVAGARPAGEAPGLGSLGQGVLRDVFTGAFGGPGAVGADGYSSSEPATISTAGTFGDAFRIQMRLSAFAPEGQLIFGPYRDGIDAGYRLIHTLGPTPTVQIVALSTGTSRIVASADAPANFADGSARLVEWRRWSDGRMTVDADGNRLIDTGDRGLSGPFEGLVIANAGGDFGVHEVSVWSMAPATAGR